MNSDEDTRTAFWPEDNSLDPRVSYWTQSQHLRNFGDYLSQYICNAALITPLFDADIYHLIGSAIHDDNVREDLQTYRFASSVIAYWCCGMRDERPLSDDVRGRCQFFGVRGPLTRDALCLPFDTTMGDPGLLMPLIYSPKQSERTRNSTVCLPHFNQSFAAEELRARAGGDVVLQAGIRSEAELLTLIDDVASADFVLTGSLHGAIVASAYGRPFAFWDTGYIDIPFKWRDFAASIGLEAVFVNDVHEGRRAYSGHQRQIRLPETAPILGCSPFAVKPSVLMRALLYDIEREAGGTNQTFATVLQLRAGMLDSSAPSFATKLRHAQAHKILAAAGEKQALLRSENALSRLGDALAELHRHARMDAEGYPVVAPPLPLTLLFTSEGSGLRFLEMGWTTALPEYGPWSLLPAARIVLPPYLGWDKADAVVLDGLLFAPHVGDSPGQRHVKVWVNDAVALDETFRHDTDQNAIPCTLNVPLHGRRQAAGDELVLTLTFDDVGSSKQLGLSAYDDRKIGLALRSATFIFKAYVTPQPHVSS